MDEKLTNEYNVKSYVTKASAKITVAEKRLLIEELGQHIDDIR